MSLTRREMLGLSLAVVLWPMPQPAEAQRFVNRTGLRAGQFVWEPSQPDDGPVTVIASMQDRLVHVYKAGVLIGISTCQVRYRGRRAPSGIFALDNRPGDEGLHSWTGVALQASYTRGLPASEGCIQVPGAFARLLEDVMHPGTLIILASQRTQPMAVSHSGSLFPRMPVHEAARMVQTVAAQSQPTVGGLAEDPEAGHVAIVISRASRNAIVLRDGIPERVERVRFVQPNSRIGTHAYSLTGVTPSGDGLLWLGFGIGRSPRDAHLVSWHGDDLLGQIVFEDQGSAAELTRLMHPGTTLVVTDELPTARLDGKAQSFSLISAAGPTPRARPRPAVRHVRRPQRKRQPTWATALLNSWR